jgi:general secretion pathway protein G
MILRKFERTNRRVAFTLTEMLVVVAIIVVLAGVAVPITFSVYADAQRSTASSVIKGTLVPAVERYRLNKEVNSEGALPASLQDLVDHAGLPADQLTDPWGHPYQYSATSTHGNQYDIWSDGDGGKQIGNWKDQ